LLVFIISHNNYQLFLSLVSSSFLLVKHLSYGGL
jgi:hypothetical protein